MGWLYVGSVLTRARVNVSPGWSAHITMDDTLVPENKHAHSHKSLKLHFVKTKTTNGVNPVIYKVTLYIVCATCFLTVNVAGSF